MALFGSLVARLIAAFYGTTETNSPKSSQWTFADDRAWQEAQAGRREEAKAVAEDWDAIWAGRR